ncbi:MAG: hypothetical protein DMF43_04545 [Verrucomicrobia bacterium]|nr:MAG: hypothetical protein DMF43_04545 [Verrucomicrobiota bacterium]
MSFSKKAAPLFGTVYLKKHNAIIARQVADFSASARSLRVIDCREHSTFSTSTALKPDFGDSAGPQRTAEVGTRTDEVFV